MNKEELKELAATLNGIADGKAWELQGPQQNWYVGDLAAHNPQRLAADGWKIRLKQQPEPFAELKAAHAAGKVIQFRFVTENNHSTWRDDKAKQPAFGLAGYEFRIKPEPQKVPLGPSDVPPGSVIRDSNVPLGRWFLVLSVGPSGLATSSDSLKTFDSLADGWEIKRLTDTEWQPCYKLIDTP